MGKHLAHWQICDWNIDDAIPPVVPLEKAEVMMGVMMGVMMEVKMVSVPTTNKTTATSACKLNPHTPLLEIVPMVPEVHRLGLACMRQCALAAATR